METGDLIAQRWSPRDFEPEPLDPAQVQEIFRAASRAQSSFNEQPWRYLIATKEDGANRDRLESYLVEENAFAKAAWILGISFAKKTFTPNGETNRTALHDLGAANQILALRAYDLGWSTRFMAGFDVGSASESAPDDFEPVAMFVIGRATEKEQLRGPSRSSRKPTSDFLFHGAWGSPLH